MGGSAAGKKFRQCPFQAEVMRLQLFYLPDGFHRRGHRHEAVEATRVVRAILVLRMAEHNASEIKRFDDGIAIRLRCA